MDAMSRAGLKRRHVSRMKPASVWQTPFTLVSAGGPADDAIALVTISAVGLPRCGRCMLRLGRNEGPRLMRTVQALIAAGQTDSGRQREVNEDRFYCDAARGLFIVIDGVGGQAAGGKAADVALSTLRKRLERETEPVAERVRRAITSANNEIYRVARTRPEFNGMACVLTVAVVGDGRVTIGHVGDTRLYKLRNHGIEKITRD